MARSSDPISLCVSVPPCCAFANLVACRTTAAALHGPLGLGWDKCPVGVYLARANGLAVSLNGLGKVSKNFLAFMPSFGPLPPDKWVGNPSSRRYHNRLRSLR